MKSTVTNIATASLFWVAACLMPGVALADVAPGPYSATFSNAHPASSHVASGTPGCVVQDNLDIICAAYTLGGVGGTNANVSLVASYSATIDCTNKGGNLVETHTVEGFTDSDSETARADRNGQMDVGTLSVSAFSAPQVCPNHNWTPSIRAGTLVLNSFSYTLTFVGFNSPYITISAP